MKCTICKQGETKDSTTTITLERHNATIVFKKVPACVCTNCGETYVAEKTTASLLVAAEKAVENGVVVDIREFKAA